MSLKKQVHVYELSIKTIMHLLIDALATDALLQTCVGEAVGNPDKVEGNSVF